MEHELLVLFRKLRDQLEAATLTLGAIITLLAAENGKIDPQEKELIEKVDRKIS